MCLACQALCANVGNSYPLTATQSDRGLVAGAEQRSGASAAPRQPSAPGTSGAPQAEVTGPVASALPPSATSAPPPASTIQVCTVLLSICEFVHLPRTMTTLAACVVLAWSWGNRKPPHIRSQGISAWLTRVIAVAGLPQPWTSSFSWLTTLPPYIHAHVY